MMSDASGGRLKVTGNSIVMATSGLIPGRMPTTVPSNAPTETVEKIGGTECDAKTKPEVAQDIHRVSSRAVATDEWAC